jgi:starch-binding outer membrane protein, SusD/RagB family
MKRRWIYLVVLPALMCSDCRKLLNVPSQQDQLTAATVYSSDANAEAAMTGIYIQVMTPSRTLLNGGMSLYAGLSSDELANTTPNPFIDPFRTNELTAGNIFCLSLYGTAYNVIFMANSLIAGLNASAGVSPAVKAELRGEAEVVRALEYFYLVNLYGGVPLVTSIDFSVTAQLPRDSVSAVYAQIEADLKDAQQVLSTSYLSTAADVGARTRPNRLAAMALLARVWLYRGQWGLAEQEADTVIGSGVYQLEPGLDSVFRSGSREAIWQLQPVNSTLTTAEAAAFVARPGLRPAYALTGEWLGVVEPGDLRRVYWTDSVVVGPVNYYYPYKYKLTGSSPVDTEYNMVIRLAEVYLIRAEARAQQGNIAGAQDDLDVVRARAGLPATMAGDGPSLLTAIWHERQVELVAEWGHRWLDLKRTGMADGVLGSEKPGWVSTDTLYPIPAQELTANPKLLQNPGYE